MAVKIIKEDEMTIRTLQHETAETRNTAHIAANKQAAMASDLVQSLNLEISALKRRIKNMEERATENLTLPTHGAAIMRSPIKLVSLNVHNEAFLGSRSNPGSPMKVFHRKLDSFSTTSDAVEVGVASTTISIIIVLLTIV